MDKITTCATRPILKSKALSPKNIAKGANTIVCTIIMIMVVIIYLNYSS